MSHQLTQGDGTVVKENPKLKDKRNNTSYEYPTPSKP
jgi:hypothetical protein